MARTTTSRPFALNASIISVMWMPSAPSASVPAATDQGPLLRAVQVVVRVPGDAIVFEGTKRLGPTPLTVGVPVSGTVTLHIERAGYTAKELTIDGSSTKAVEDISLEREPVRAGLKGTGPKIAPSAPAVKPPPPPPTPSATAPRPASTERPSSCLPEDWDMFAHVCRK